MSCIDSKEYKEGVKAWEKSKHNKDNPYPHGTREWQAWTNGWGDRSEEAFIAAFANPKIAKKTMLLLKNKSR